MSNLTAGTPKKIHEENERLVSVAFLYEELYSECCERAKLEILTWAKVAKRVGCHKDIVKIVSMAVWNDRCAVFFSSKRRGFWNDFNKVLAATEKSPKYRYFCA